ncbi:hypothetical protein, partial [Streptomyces sp. SID1328]|uniref:hypothetical protein n=1 Tax=Streptomyces sp. SID1328 TaxID=2690250 RepID=UPI001F204875
RPSCPARRSRTLSTEEILLDGELGQSELTAGSEVTARLDVPFPGSLVAGETFAVRFLLSGYNAREPEVDICFNVTVPE